ncbi:MAG: DUF3341 domain-containing protein [Anaerolineales bacterium]|nr:DUF3341 domain-containing protein [Anaerolineales bacterium]
MKNPATYGLLAEFTTPEALIEATHQAHEAGYRKMDAYTPYPIEEVGHALGARGTRLPYIVLAGGIMGAIGGYLLQYYASVIDYPLNIGGRPYHSWPSFIPATFETTVLLAAFAAVLGMLALNGLPQPYHPVFGVPGFEAATRDRFFLQIEARDPKFDLEETRNFLESFHPEKVSEIERYKYPG